jgi:hypothetical protein
MGLSKGNKTKILSLLAILAVLAAVNLDLTKRILGQGRDLFWNLAAAAESAIHPGSGASGAGGTPAPAAAVAPNAQGEAESAVETYMRRNAMPQSTFSFIDWTDFANDGQTAAITLRYSVQQLGRVDVTASVRFTLQAGNVVKAEVIRPGLQAAPPPIAARPQLPTPRPVVVDRFSGPLFDAMHGPPMTLQLSDAFSLSQLDQAKAKAQAERKPLGFIMVWGQFFDHEAAPRGRGSDSALVHFYQVFNQSLVLVFVRHESELSQAPPAVGRGFSGVNEGGYAPNMAVTDASATEFIVEIPYKHLDGDGRDPIFAAGGRKIDEWLATHPQAMATPAATP